MIKKTSNKQNNNKEKKLKTNIKAKNKQIIKKTKSTNLNSKNISNRSKPKSKKTTSTTKSNLAKSKKNIVVKRSSGRKEKFDTDRLTQTVSRSGVSFPVAKGVAKSVTKKIKKSVQTNKPTAGTINKKKQQQQQRKQKQQSSSAATTKQKLKTNAKKEQETVTINASQIKNLVKDELKDRNQQDHSPSFSDNAVVAEESSMKITLDDKEPVLDNVASNKNKILFDPSKQK
jgi:hypothetical protein